MRDNQRMKLTGAAILVSRGVKVLPAAPAAYPYRSAAITISSEGRAMYRTTGLGLMRLLAIALTWCGVAGTVSAQDDDGSTRFRDLPKGWAVEKTVLVSPRDLAAMNKKFGGQIVRIANTYLSVDKQSLQVNVISCQTVEDAIKVQATMLHVFHVLCSREERVVFEIRGQAVERAYRELGFKLPTITYDVSFKATPIAKCEPMEWNKMYLAFRPKEPNEAAIRNLSKSFTFGDQIRLRNHGLGSKPSAFVFGTKPMSSTLEAEGEITAHSFAGLASTFGIPQVDVSAVITSEPFAITPSQRKAEKELLEATEFWPSTDEEIVTLARQITGQSTGAGDKVAALLAWFSDKKNFKYDDRIVGSRYGVKTALRQRFGMCWDYSDCFVTLCRASGVPCRQVYGWLYPLGGHVWAEVLIEGKGWRQVDAHAGMGCDSRYVPFVASESGAMPLVYTSAVRIVPREAKDRNR